MPEQQDLGGGVQQVFAAHNMGDFHVGIVDRVGDQEHRRAVAPAHHEVLEFGVVEDNCAPHQIVNRRLAIVGCAEPNRNAFGVGHIAISAEAVVAPLEPGLGVAGIDRVTGAVTSVRIARFEQRPNGIEVQLCALGLVVGALVPNRGQAIPAV